MYAPFFADVLGPGFFIVASLPYALLGMVLIVPAEAFALWLSRWDRFRRALLASLAANAMTTALGVVILFPLITLCVMAAERVLPRPTDYEARDLIAYVLVVVIAFLLSFFIEARVLMRFKPAARRANWRGALAMNLLSYGLVLGPFLGRGFHALFG